jgi:transposase
MRYVMKRKERMNYSNEQKLEYARMMVENNYSNQQVKDISGASSSAIVRWKRQYLSELNGNTPLIGSAITPEQQRIKELEKQLARAERDIDILKKATALFIQNH